MRLLRMCKERKREVAQVKVRARTMNEKLADFAMIKHYENQSFLKSRISKLTAYDGREIFRDTSEAD